MLGEGGIAGQGAQGKMLRAGGPVWALGTMSGTSLDGVDAAMVLTDGESVQAFGPSAFRPYSAPERAMLQAALGRWPHEPGVAEAARVVEEVHAEIMARFRGVEVAGFHGQTLAHDPGGRGTHQAGDGGLLARALGMRVVWDFRTSDVALGGQGAPLVPFYHHALVRGTGLAGPVAVVNLGGVANVTWVDPALPPEAGGCLAFDCGPCNAPLNDLMQARRGLTCDEGGALSLTGRAEGTVVADFLAHRHFRRMPPKSLDRDAFAGLLPAVAGLADADAARTLVACAAAGVAAAAEHFPAPVTRWLVSGGGRLNAALMGELSARIPAPLTPVEDLGLDGDMIEAQAFGFLAVRVLRGLATSCPMTTGVAAAVGGGRVSEPGAPEVPQSLK